MTLRAIAAYTRKLRVAAHSIKFSKLANMQSWRLLLKDCMRLSSEMGRSNVVPFTAETIPNVLVRRTLATFGRAEPALLESVRKARVYPNAPPCWMDGPRSAGAQQLFVLCSFH